MDQNRNYVYIFKSVHGTTSVINYSGESSVNTFLHYFDIWGSWGHQVLCSDENHSKFEFECSADFFEMCHILSFKLAFLRMGVRIVDSYDLVKNID